MLMEIFLQDIGNFVERFLPLMRLINMSTEAATFPRTPIAATAPFAAIPIPSASQLPTTILDDASLPDDLDTLKRMIRELLDLLRSRDRELSGVRHRLDQLLRRLYGPKGEKFRPDQLVLFELLNGCSTWFVIVTPRSGSGAVRTHWRPGVPKMPSTVRCC